MALNKIWHSGLKGFGRAGISVSVDRGVAEAICVVKRRERVQGAPNLAGTLPHGLKRQVLWLEVRRRIGLAFPRAAADLLEGTWWHSLSLRLRSRLLLTAWRRRWSRRRAACWLP